MKLEYLKNFLITQNYPEEMHSEIIDVFNSILENEKAKALLEYLENAYKTDRNYDFKELIAKTKETATETGINVYTFRLIVLISYTEILKEYYKEFGISEDIWYNTVQDILYKTKECKLLNGVCGICTEGWYAGFYRLYRFAFGRLQFEIDKFGKTYQFENGVVYPTDYVLNVHIPRTETKLDKTEVSKSYDLASKFFAKFLRKDITPFLCHSWLLYPTTTEYAGENSNISKFASDYEIFEVGDNADYSEVWRLFDTYYQGNANLLPQNSSLRKKYAEHIKNGKPFGYGFGIYIYKK